MLSDRKRKPSTRSSLCQIDIGNATIKMTKRAATGVLVPNRGTMAESWMDVRHVAEAVVYIASLPWDAHVQFLTAMASKCRSFGRR
jgi:hypothetical protein